MNLKKINDSLEGIELDHSNLYFLGAGFDVNGNEILKFRFPNGNAFSFQVAAFYPQCSFSHGGKRTPNGEEFLLANKNVVSKDDIEKMVVDYIVEYGTKNQKDRLHLYK